MKKILLLLFLMLSIVSYSQVGRQGSGHCQCTPVVPAPVPPEPLALELEWDDIANVPVADASSFNDWNTFFDLPTYGTPFTSLEIDVNTVKLYGGAGITLKDNLFVFGDPSDHLTSIDDKAECITKVNYDCFYYVPNLTFVSLPNVLEIEYESFYGCGILTDIILTNCLIVGNDAFYDCAFLNLLDISSCINLGTTTGGNGVFGGISGQTIAVTCDASLLTCNGGAPDGDLCYLHDNNTITVNGAPLAGCP